MVEHITTTTPWMGHHRALKHKGSKPETDLNLGGRKATVASRCQAKPILAKSCCHLLFYFDSQKICNACAPKSKQHMKITIVQKTTA
jgi:hypothetical protein